MLVATHFRVSCCLTGSCPLILVNSIDGVHFSFDTHSRCGIFSHSFIHPFTMWHCYFFPPHTQTGPPVSLLARALELLLVSVANSSYSLSLILSPLYDSFSFFSFAIVSCNSLRPLGFLFHHFDQSGQVLQRVLPRLSNPLPLALMQHRWSFSSLREQAGSIGSNARA